MENAIYNEIVRGRKREKMIDRESLYRLAASATFCAMKFSYRYCSGFGCERERDREIKMQANGEDKKSRRGGKKETAKSRD